MKRGRFFIKLDANITGPLSSVHVGQSTSINSHFNVRCKKGTLLIVKSCKIARNVTIACCKYDLTNPYPEQRQALLASEVVIGDNVVIGTGAIIMPGVHIGQGAYIGANAVVTKSVDGHSVVAGIPARLIRYLDVL